jgi:DNA-binding XRE family transcriptional regulator
MRHTEVTITEGKKTMRFHIPVAAGRGLVTLMSEFQEKLDQDSVPANEVFPDLKDPEKRIGIVFRGIRFKNGLTQADVAKQLGIDQSDVSKIEKGKRPVGKSLAKKIQRKFGIDYRRFL